MLQDVAPKRTPTTAPTANARPEGAGLHLSPPPQPLFSPSPAPPRPPVGQSANDSANGEGPEYDPHYSDLDTLEGLEAAIDLLIPDRASAPDPVAGKAPSAAEPRGQVSNAASPSGSTAQPSAADIAMADGFVDPAGGDEEGVGGGGAPSPMAVDATALASADGDDVDHLSELLQKVCTLVEHEYTYQAGKIKLKTVREEAETMEIITAMMKATILMERGLKSALPKSNSGSNRLGEATSASAPAPPLSRERVGQSAQNEPARSRDCQGSSQIRPRRCSWSRSESRSF